MTIKEKVLIFNNLFFHGPELKFPSKHQEMKIIST